MTDPCQSIKEVPFDVLVFLNLSQKRVFITNITKKLEEG
jgi:hypothetical protein